VSLAVSADGGTVQAMRRTAWRQNAEPGTCFARGAFDGSIGKPVNVVVLGVDTGEGTLVAAEVAEDGQSVLFTADLPDLAGEALEARDQMVQQRVYPFVAGECSFAFGPVGATVEQLEQRLRTDRGPLGLS
jgi:hypothetical protein